MLFKLSVKNIRRSVKDYAIYFLTLTLGVATYYIFNAIETQTVMMRMSESKYEIIKLLTSLLGGVSVFVAFVLGFLIVYASVFLIKRRKKEFGVYMTLGMSRGKISRLLFCETLLIGIFSLFIGIIAGIGLSQIMSVIVAYLFEADMTQFVFTVSTNAIIKTLICFGIMYVIVILFNTISVSRCKLIDLLNASKKGEKLRLKNPAVCILTFIAAAAILGYAYYEVTARFDTLSEEKIYLAIALGCIGTFLVFWSLSGLILKIVRACKGLYYKKLNSFVLRQTSSKMNTNVFSMTVICLMLFVTICVLSAGISINDSMTRDLQTLCPVDFCATWRIGQDTEDISQEDLDYIAYDDAARLKSIGLEPTDLSQTAAATIYRNESVTTKTMMPNDNAYDFLEDIVSVSDYNRIAALYGHETLTLNDNEYIVIADHESSVQLRNKAIADGVKLKLGNKEYVSKYTECKPGFLMLSNTHSTTGIFIVPDNAIKECAPALRVISAAYAAQTDDARQEIEARLTEENLPKNVSAYRLPSVLTRISLYESSVGLGAIVIFIGIYLGFIFLISSAAILALKELSESTDNRLKYAVLRKIGADEKLINGALLKQIAIFFTAPLLLACIHSIFGIWFTQKAFAAFSTKPIGLPILITAAAIILIYGGYFLLTYLCSKHMIKDSRV